MTGKNKEIIAKIIFGLLLAIVTMIMWNHLIPEIFGFNEVNYVQMVGLILLYKFITK